MRRTHIITGATGFVGSALIIELLRHTEDVIIALVRPGDSTPDARLRAAVLGAARVYDVGPEVEGALHRCRAVAGDVREAECGVREDIAAPGMQFWHCAASLRYENRYQDEIRATNVEGMRQALALASRLSVEAFNYVSTAYVAGTATGVIVEAPRAEIEANNHYERSKADAEALVAASTCARVRIFRPSIIVGHSRTRAATTFSGYYGFIRQLVQLRGMMERTQAGLAERIQLRMRVDQEVGLNFVPIDTVVEEMVRIALVSGGEGVFHLTHPSPPTVGSAIRVVCRALALRDPEFTRAKDDFEWLDEQLDRRLDFYSSYLVGDKRFDRQRADAALGGRRGPMVTFDEATLDAFARWYLARLDEERKNLPVAR